MKNKEKIARQKEIFGNADVDHKSNDKCTQIDCECYPYYGRAPHAHYWLGETEAPPIPKNFTPIADEDNLMGVYYCPKCLKGQEEEREKLTNIKANE
jgi:hypothetical protein